MNAQIPRLLAVYCLKLTEYPNDEIRVVPYKPRTAVFSYDETHETRIENGTSVLPRSAPASEKEGCSLLDIGSKVETTPTPEVAHGKPGWGGLPRRQPFSRYGRRQLMRVGGVFGKCEMNPQDVVFLTGTLPGSTKEAFEGIARYSAFLVHGLKAWVNKRVPSKWDFYVWEHQKRGALHLHYAVYCPDKDTAEKMIKDFPAQWVRLLRRVSLESGVDMFDSGRGFSWTPEYAATLQYGQRVIKDVSRYLAKYVSKNGGGRTVDADESRFCPSRWYGVSRPLLSKLRELTVEKIFYFCAQREVFRKCEEIYGWLANLANVCHTYCCRVTGHKITVAYGSHWNLEKLCLETNLAMQTEKILSQKSLTPTEWTVGYLSAVIRRYQISSCQLSRNSSIQAMQTVIALEKRLSPSILGTMDLIHALRWNLYWKYRDRMKPSSYQEDMRKLDALWSRLRELRIQGNFLGDEPLVKIDNIVVDKSTM